MIGVLVVLATGQAAAAPADDVPRKAEEVVVTGERTNRSVKNTPSSVVVFGKRAMDQMAAPDRLQQLLQMVPNVLVPTTRDAPTIRGQSGVGVLQALPAFLGGARPRTVMQIDGRTVTFNEFVNSTEGIWDTEHVEVFRSPQTTTQGVNSIGGAIFIHTTDPAVSYEGHAQVIGGQSRRRQSSAALSGPILGDELSFRISGDVYCARASTNMRGPIVGIGDLTVDRYWTVRTKLLAQPRAIAGLRVMTTYAHTRSQAPQTEFTQAPFRKRRDDNYVFGYFKSDVDSVTSAITYELADPLEWRSTISAGRSHFRRFAPQGLGQTQIRGGDWSAESLLDWKPAGTISALGGVSLQNVKLQQSIDLSAASLGNGSFDDRQRSAGLFAEITWHASERSSLTAGARYQVDGKRRTGLLRMSPDLPLQYDVTTRAFLPKVSGAYDLSKHVRVGVLVQRAYNPGGTTLDPAHRTQLDFKPEYLWDFEAFTRASMFGGKASLNANLFYNVIRDAQRELDFELNSPGGHVGLLQIISEPKARTYGAEFDFAAQLTDRLSIRSGLGLLHTRITKGVATNDPLVGHQFFGAPAFTAAAGLNWEVARDFRLSSQVHRVTGFAGDDTGDPLLRTKGFWMVDGRASLDAGRFTLFAYGQNLLDTFQVIGWTGSRDNSFVHVEVTDAREMGVGLQARF